MFQSRVMGVGSIAPGGRSPYDDILDIRARAYTDGGMRATVCHSQSPAGTCKPPDWMPPVAVPDAPAKPTALSLPLVLGAAYLLLS
jgi:hypothetical protein